jgi:hypothetical protein
MTGKSRFLPCLEWFYRESRQEKFCNSGPTTTRQPNNFERIFRRHGGGRSVSGIARGWIPPVARLG